MAKTKSQKAAELLEQEGDDKLRALRSAESQIARLKCSSKLAEDKQRQAEAELEQARERLELFAALSDVQAPRPIKPKRVKAADGTAIIALSDWHVEETVEADKVNGFNQFNLDIAEQRIARTFEKALLLLEDARHLTDIRECVVAVLGDMISGHIHDELVESNSLAPLPATMFAAEHLERGIKSLLQFGKLEQITIPTCYGNHGRSTKKIRVSTGAENSFEYNLYLHLARRFDGDKRVRWQIGSGYHNWLEVQGRAVRFHHGDAINYWGGVGGLTIPVNKAIAQWNKIKRADLDIFGHFHTFTPGLSWICNGSLIGYGPFSLRIKSDFQVPLQTFAVIDRDRGLTRALPIFCD